MMGIRQKISHLSRYLHRSEWFIKLFNLTCHDQPAAPGLVLIQIDGLAYPQLQQALDKGEMPFLKHLLQNRQYRLHRTYSGLPSTTPACQGELFYGLQTAVPAFSFMDRESGQIVRMYEPATATKVEIALANNGHSPLLKGGSAYVANFTGGAEEPHFCPAALGWGLPLRRAKPWVLALFLLTHWLSFARLAALLVIEFGLALVDFLRGIIEGQDFFKELKFIPTRVGICILLRELATIGAYLDVARGLPVIHLNFLGYDEQAHRRGPDSLFAHWSLKGIDAAIGKIWYAAQRSQRRKYQVWIYSDHGQERVISYEERFGTPPQKAICHVFSKAGISQTLRSAPGRGDQTLRIRWFGGKRIQRLFPIFDDSGPDLDTPQPLLAALGPVGHLYLHHPLPRERQIEIAKLLATEACIPVVMIKDTPNRVRAFTDEGECILPQQAAALFGDDHPFLSALGRDWIALCHHPNAGDWILVGWRKGRPPMSFAIENGAHAGAGPQETAAFTLLPGSVQLSAHGNPFPRAIHLRKAIQAFLGISATVAQ